MEMKQIRVYDTPERAYIVKGYLANNDIQAEVRSNASSMLFPAPDAGIGASVLYVPAGCFARAEALLNERGD